MKKCNSCFETRLLIDFPYRYKKHNIRKSICKYCDNKRRAESYKANITREQTYRKLYLADKGVIHNENRKIKYHVDPKEKAKRCAYACYNAAITRRKYIKCDCCTRQEILEFYINRPVDNDVDHIIRAVDGGKHCLKNLQYLEKSKHRLKSNREISK